MQTVRRSAGFAAEAAAARIVREHLRSTLGLGRDETLAAAYWRRGAAGPMAGWILLTIACASSPRPIAIRSPETMPDMS
ncbi:SIP domain-containing protein, partial [Mesorhizobium sp.]|uniref:SIP domain-containing protein n=1 Tax=Mesorhizobium sp. TaxID=1871066 RepID=UPI00338E8095